MNGIEVEDQFVDSVH